MIENNENDLHLHLWSYDHLHLSSLELKIYIYIYKKKIYIYIYIILCIIYCGDIIVQKNVAKKYTRWSRVKFLVTRCLSMSGKDRFTYLKLVD